MPVIIREVLLLVLKEHPQDSISGQGRSLLGHTAYELQHKKKPQFLALVNWKKSDVWKFCCIIKQR